MTSRHRTVAGPRSRQQALIETVLVIPNRTALSTIREGDILDVVLRRGPPPYLVVVNFEGAAVGALDSELAAQLSNRAGASVRYSAHVVKIEGMKCTVRVTHLRKHT